jgi:DNA-binding SARP family transcriptional activator
MSLRERNGATAVDPHPTTTCPAAMAMSPAPAAIQLGLIGGFRLSVREAPITLPEGAQRLIAFLALRRRPQTRLCVAGNLWPEKSDARATANLRSTMWRARLPDGSTILEVSGSLIGISPHIELDVREIEALKAPAIVAMCARDQCFAYERLFEELLPGWYDDWVILERERLAQLQLRIAECVAVTLAAHGDVISAVDIAHRTQLLDPSGYSREHLEGELRALGSG